MNGARHSLKTQIAEVVREIEQRQKVYPRMVAQRTMKQGEAEYRIAVMESVKRTLEWLARHEPAIKARAGEPVAETRVDGEG